uniref:C2H2-type domain-containing protein n=1 Tax=Neolamprologus brichardi TaxID=32507 RepID=A0A3Q4IDG0_NEOBR
MWQVARHEMVRHYGMLEDFVSLVTEAVPQLLTDRQRCLLLLALRAKVGVLQGENATVRPQVIQTMTVFTQSFIIQSVHHSPLSVLVFQEVFDQRFDSALQSLISDFLSRIEQLFPVPDFKQVISKTLNSQSSNSLPVFLQSDLSCSEVTANGLHSISHNSQRVAHKCLSDCLQVIRHLRTNRSCGSALTTSVLEQTQPGGADKEPCLPQNRPPPRPVRSLSCFQCNAMFKTKAELLSHQRTHRARPIYHCIQCDKEFHHLSSLTNHRQTHLDKGGFTCSRCNKVFESAKERDAHRLQHRLPDLTCTMCDQTFSSQTRLLRHLQTHSVEGAKLRYNCRFCDQTFSGRSLKAVNPTNLEHFPWLRIHQRTHTFRTYQCDLCSKTYGSLTGLQSHRATHTAESRFLCSQCGKRFKTRDGLEGHLRTHTGERPFRCPYCSKDFTALAGLNVHVRRHTGERPYVCTVCGKGWPSGGDLQKHMRTHTGERPYVCQDCGKAFSISCHLTEHRRIHTGEKPFSCPECGKCLRRKFDLKKHMLSHSNIRPYACTFCTKSYTRKTHLNRHLLTHRTLAKMSVMYK